MQSPRRPRKKIVPKHKEEENDKENVFTKDQDENFTDQFPRMVHSSLRLNPPQNQHNTDGGNISNIDDLYEHEYNIPTRPCDI